MTDESTAMVTAEQQALLNKHAKEFSGKSDFPSIPRLKIAKEADPTNEIVEGDFILTKRIKNDNDEYVDKIKVLGQKAKVVILMMKMRYSWFDNASGKYLIQTNEFNSFDPDEKVVVYDQGKVTHEVGYAEFKKLRATNWVQTFPNGESKSVLKLSYVVYVVVNGIVAAMTLPLSSYVGTNAEGRRDFKQPEEGSLMDLQKKSPNEAPYAYFVDLTNEKKSFVNKASKQEITFYRIIFKRADQSPLIEMMTKRQDLEKALIMIEDSKYARGKKDNDEVPIPDDEEEVTIEDVPATPAAIAPTKEDSKTLGEIDIFAEQ